MKNIVFYFLFCDFFERGYHKTKRECARMKSRRSFKLNKINDEAIYLTMVQMVLVCILFFLLLLLLLLFKVLLVALGIGLSIYET